MEPILKDMGSFEDEIKQSKFDSQRHKVLLNVMYTSNWLRDKTAPLFKVHGILQQHYNILRIVRGQKGNPTSPGQILKVMLDKGRDMTRLVDKLVKAGYLERTTSTVNRRNVEIYITEKGLEVTEIIENQINKFHRSVGINDAQAKQLSDLLDRLRG